MAFFFCLSLIAAQPTKAEAAAAYAQALVGKHDITAAGARYALDSVGLVRAAFMAQGVDVFEAPALMDPSRTGVDVVYQYAALNGHLHTSRKPKVGDVVFFGRTRDQDGDGAPDPVSHLGIVTEMKADGTATVVTATRSQIVALVMNRLRPKDAKDELDAPLNSQLYVTKAKEPRLVSALFYTFATLAE